MNFFLDSNYIVFNMTAGADPFATGSVTVDPAPVAVVPGPVAVTTAPVVGTTVPVIGTAATVAATIATVTAATTAPVAATTAPVAGTTAPVAATTAPVADTTAPVAGTTVPVAGTTVPVADTTAPVAGTTAPVAASTSSGECSAVEKLAVTNVKKESHPSTDVMVLSAIRGLNGKNGSSLQAIKKYLAVNYKIDSTKLAPSIGRFLRRAVANRTIVQTKGSGASGRFKLPDVVIKQEMVEAVVAKKKKKRVKTAGAPEKK